MKRITAILAALAFCTLPTFAADLTQEEIVAEKSCGAGKMWIPEGSNIVTTEDGALEVEAPEGWVYIGEDLEGKTQALLSAGCSCSCNSGSGSCLPSVFKGDCTCTAKDGCTGCDLSTGGGGGTEIQQAFKSAASALGIEPLRDYAEIQNGGYINMKAGVGFADGEEDLPLVFKAMFEVPAVQKALARFFDELYPNGIAPEPVDLGDRFLAPRGYELATINVFGRSAVVVVPQDPSNASLEKAVISGGGGSCACTQGSCTYDSVSIPFKGTLHYCEGDCSGTCTLSGVSEKSLSRSRG